MIRKYEARDLEALLNVWAAASAVAHPFLSEEDLQLQRRNIPEVYLPKAETWVWEADGLVVGFIALLGAEVGALFVDPRFHRAGIGRALMDWARALRGELEVEVFTANTLGRAFYASYGFTLIRRTIHESAGLELMRLRLAPTPSGSRQ